MANLSWSAVGARGHIAAYDLSARDSIILDLQNSSYNDVSIRPAILYVQNSVNDSGVVITSDSGIAQTVPGRVNHRIDVSGQPRITLLNSGRATCRIFVLDAAAMSESYSTLAVFDTVNAANLNDILLHMEGSSYNVNSGVESIISFSDFGVVATTTSHAKFGVKSLAISNALSGVQLQNNSFFDFSKNFTLDLWLKYTTGNGDFIIAGFANSLATRLVSIERTNPGGIPNLPSYIELYINGTTYTGTTVLPYDDWFFIRLTRDNGIWAVHVDGTEEIRVSNSYNAALNYMFLGSNTSAVGNGTVGWYDEVRYSKGFVPDNPSEVPDAAYI